MSHFELSYRKYAVVDGGVASGLKPPSQEHTQFENPSVNDINAAPAPEALSSSSSTNEAEGALLPQKSGAPGAFEEATKLARFPACERSDTTCSEVSQKDTRAPFVEDAYSDNGVDRTSHSPRSAPPPRSSDNDPFELRRSAGEGGRSPMSRIARHDSQTPTARHNAHHKARAALPLPSQSRDRLPKPPRHDRKTAVITAVEPPTSHHFDDAASSLPVQSADVSEGSSSRDASCEQQGDEDTLNHTSAAPRDGATTPTLPSVSSIGVTNEPTAPPLHFGCSTTITNSLPPTATPPLPPSQAFRSMHPGSRRDRAQETGFTPLPDFSSMTPPRGDGAVRAARKSTRSATPADRKAGREVPSMRRPTQSVQTARARAQQRRNAASSSPASRPTPTSAQPDFFPGAKRLDDHRMPLSTKLFLGTTLAMGVVLTFFVARSVYRFASTNLRPSNPPPPTSAFVKARMAQKRGVSDKEAAKIALGIRDRILTNMQRATH